MVLNMMFIYLIIFLPKALFNDKIVLRLLSLKNGFFRELCLCTTLIQESQPKGLAIHFITLCMRCACFVVVLVSERNEDCNDSYDGVYFVFYSVNTLSCQSIAPIFTNNICFLQISVPKCSQIVLYLNDFFIKLIRSPSYNTQKKCQIFDFFIIKNFN